MGKKKKVALMDCKVREMKELKQQAADDKERIHNLEALVKDCKGRIKELEEEIDDYKEAIDNAVKLARLDLEHIEEWFAYCRKRFLELGERIVAYDRDIEALEAQLEAYEKEGVDSDGQRN